MRLGGRGPSISSHSCPIPQGELAAALGLTSAAASIARSFALRRMFEVLQLRRAERDTAAPRERQS